MAKIDESAQAGTPSMPVDAPVAEGGQAARVSQVLPSEEADGDGQDDFKPLTREQAQQWRASQPHVSAWSVLKWQGVLALLAVLVAAALFRRQAVVVSVLYGAVAVMVPSGLMAWGLTKSALSRRVSGGASASLAVFFVWEGAKVLLAIALLALAPRLVPDLSWLAMVAGLVVVLKAHWLELWFRTRRSK
jgi:ATP synthase protein I